MGNSANRLWVVILSERSELRHRDRNDGHYPECGAKIIAEHFGTSAVHVGGTYDTYTVEDDTGRKWKVVSDASIQCQSRGERTASRLYAVEVVSPICKYEDIETIQELVRELRRGGAKVNDSCGIHIHVDASRHDPKTLRNIVNLSLIHISEPTRP